MMDLLEHNSTVGQGRSVVKVSSLNLDFWPYYFVKYYYY